MKCQCGSPVSYKVNLELFPLARVTCGSCAARHSEVEKPRCGVNHSECGMLLDANGLHCYPEKKRVVEMPECPDPLAHVSEEEYRLFVTRDNRQEE